MDPHEHCHVLQECLLLSLTCILDRAVDLLQQYFIKTSYHTSMLTGEGWVTKLLGGHPECIRCELDMNQHVFLKLRNKIHLIGYGDSRHVSLEEQIAIFLYTCVTGLSVRHVGERFQHSNSTISQ